MSFADRPSDPPVVPPPHSEASQRSTARFEELVASRREWIANVLQPWCVHAPLRELRKAEQEWGDIAGQVSPESTLWAWAWSRFPALVAEGLTGIDETHPVRVVLHDHRTFVGFPDRRASSLGALSLVPLRDANEPERNLGPFSLDDVASVTRLEL